MLSFFKQNAFVISTKIITNQANPGTSMPIEMEIDNSKCSEPVSAIRVGLARSVNVPKNIIRKKFKMESEEIVFATSGSMPANQISKETINLVIPSTTTEKYSNDERPTG